MIFTLDESQATDPAAAGAKAAWLATGRRAGLPVLEGVVVSADVSKDAMAHGAGVMQSRGSGGARMAITGSPLPDALVIEIERRTAPFAEPMVVRSSSVLEGGGEWSGTFTSYLEMRQGELATAVRGCWASAFTVHALERYRAAGIEPGSVPMAVLIQPALDVDHGGTARITGEDVQVVGVEGSPAPLVQGWAPGAHVRVSGSGSVSGDAGLAVLGRDLPATVASVLLSAHDAIGATSCEWGAIGPDVTLFQLMRSPRMGDSRPEVPPEVADPAAIQVARAVRRAPGPMGESLVLPWILARPGLLDVDVTPIDMSPDDALTSAIEQSATLTAEVHGRPKPMALEDAQRMLKALRSSDPGEALDRVTRLRAPDPDRARLVLRLLATVRRGLVDRGIVSRPELAWHIEPATAGAFLSGTAEPRLRDRIGFDRWEPFDAAVVMSHGTWAEGASAAPGVGVGRLCFVSDPHDTAHFRSRDVVIGTHPIPNLAALLWDASALVTTGGSPAAHLFESARALAIPALCGIHLDQALGMPLDRLDHAVSIAVDGTNGRAAVMPW